MVINMERTERLFTALGDIDPALIAAVDLRPAAKPRAMWKKWLPAAACFCLAAMIGLAAQLLPQPKADISTTSDRTEYPPAETVASVEPSTSPELESAYPLTTKTAAGKFNHFTVGAATYTAINTNGRISPLFLDGKLGEAEADATGPSNPETRPITYYRILGVSEQCAVAVIFEGSEDIYVYGCDTYRPTTMAELLTNAGADEYLTLGKVTLTRAENEHLHKTVYHTQTELTMTHLLHQMGNASLVSVSKNAITPAARPFLLQIQGDMIMFGDSYLEILITQNGYLVLPLFGSNYIFKIDDAVLTSYLEALESQADSTRTESEIIPFSRDFITAPTLPSVYNKITVGNITYQCSTCEYGIDADRVGEPLGEMKAGIAEQAPTVTYYRLKEISEECGIAVRFPGSDLFYSYYNADYRPDTLGDLIDDLGLTSYLRMENPIVTYREATVTQTARFTANDPALLWRYLLENTAAENIAAADARKPSKETVRIEVPVLLPLFTGAKEFSLWITEDGNLRVDLLDIECLFPIEFDESRQAQYIFYLILRYPNFGLQATDSVPRESTAPWQELPLCEQYSGFELNMRVYATEKKTVDPSAIGEKLGEGTAVGIDPKTRMMHRAPIAYYEIADTHPARSVAVRFTGEEDQSCYLYTINGNYMPDTLGEFCAQTEWLGQIHIYSIATFIEGAYRKNVHLRFPTADIATVKELLFTKPDAPNIYKSDGIRSGGEYFAIDARLIQDDGTATNVTIYVYSAGYLTVYLNRNRNNPYCFDIGTERTDAFIEHILRDCADTATVSSGTLLLGDGETRQEAITRQLNEKFVITEP